MDALVKSALAHWAPRFVANGVALTDFEEVTASIGPMFRLRLNSGYARSCRRTRRLQCCFRALIA